jgi:hypothetical protein
MMGFWWGLRNRWVGERKERFVVRGYGGGLLEWGMDRRRISLKD